MCWYPGYFWSVLVLRPFFWLVLIEGTQQWKNKCTVVGTGTVSTKPSHSRCWELTVDHNKLTPCAVL